MVNSLSTVICRLLSVVCCLLSVDYQSAKIQNFSTKCKPFYFKYTEKTKKEN